MNQKTRHYLFLFFVFLFCIITPAISLYASGYKINKGFKLQKTGILIIDSNPADAKIYIDNEIQQNFLNKILQKKEGFTTTPEKIKNILPGEYKVRIEKENYWPWEKKLTIQSGETTFAEDIRLFKKDLPIISQKGDYLDAKVYLIDDKLITITDNKVIFQTEKDKTITHQKDSKTDIQIKISPRKEKIIIDKYIYDLQNP